MAKDLLRIADLSSADLTDLVDLAAALERHPRRFHRALAAELVVLYFTRPSTLTRITFSDASSRLGATVVMLGPAELQRGRAVNGTDIARFVGHYAAIVVAHTDEEDLRRFAEQATVPVVSGLSPRFDLCQSLGDLLTLREEFGSLDGLSLAYVGEATPAAQSLIEACALAAVDLRLAIPGAHGLDPDVVAAACAAAAESGGQVVLTEDPLDAVDDADAVYVGPLSSNSLSPGLTFDPSPAPHMACAHHEAARLVDCAGPGAVLLHGPPPRGGRGIARELVRHPRARIRNQAENRIHCAAAMLVTVHQSSPARSSVISPTSLTTPGFVD